MAASDVYSALNAAITGPDRRIDLWTATTDSTALADLKPVLELFRISGPYELIQANLAGDNTTVTLTASGSFGQPGAAAASTYAITAALIYNDSARFALSMRVVDSRPWTFAAFFPTLPGSQRFTPAPDTPDGIRWTPSFLIGSRPGYEVVVNSPTFTGRNGNDETLQLAGFLPEFADPDISLRLGLLSPWPLRLHGSVVMPASASDFPLMELFAQGSSTNMLTSNRAVGMAADVPQGPANFDVNTLFLVISVKRLALPNLGQSGLSSLMLNGTFDVGDGLSGTISTPLLASGKTWSFHAEFNPETSSLTRGLASLTRMFGVELPIPMDFPLLSEFHFAEIDVDLWNDAADGSTVPQFSLRCLGISIKSNEAWVAPVPFAAQSVSFKDVGIRWVWGSTVAEDPDTGLMRNIYLLTGSVFGSIHFGSGDGGQSTPPPLTAPSPSPPPPRPGSGVTFDLGLELPSFFISGGMRDGDTIAVSDALEGYFGGSCPIVPPHMNVTALSFTADPIGQVYQARAQIVFDTPGALNPNHAWTIMQVGTVGISLQQLSMWVQALGGRVSGGISGAFFLLGAGEDAYTAPQLTLSAEYPLQSDSDPQGWLFTAQLYPGTSIDLTDMVARFIKGEPGYRVPNYVPHLLIDRLDATFATGTEAYTFGGTASMRWPAEIFGTQLTVNASASADIARIARNAPVTGTLSGTFAVNKITVLASMDIGVAEPTYLLKVLFGELWVEATTSWRGGGDPQQPPRHQVASIQLGGITLGDILEYLVNLAAPTQGFRLDPPWDLLKRVDLSRFVLTLDPQENTVEFVFNAAVDLGVMRVDTLGARYTRGTGQGQVELILTGNFFGQAYGAADPLSWDVVNDSPPAVPGQGPSTVDLRFLGIGQRVTFSGPTPDTVAASVTALRNAMEKPEPGKDPLAGTGLVYSDVSQWLMALDIGLLDTVNLGLIFNDPKLYGLSIALGGERAGSLAGLRFEILYKKITNDIGMYRIELRVPDAFRTFQLGAVSVTLGIVVIEIYTNGNFKIDLGFPYNRDYSRSFTVQAAIFIGRGGLYFGVLNGDTSTSVPSITNGNFSPVIELGMGLAAGVGRDISVGILSGGAYVELEVLFQGVLGWFNPTSSGASPAIYFRAQGVLAIHGKVYGKVDFGVISASVTLEAYAQAMVVFECYRPILLDFSVGVDAEASVKIVFIRVHFHFSVTLELSFTIGNASPTPWILASGSNNLTTARLASPGRSGVWQSLQQPAVRRAAMRQAHLALWRSNRLTLGLGAGASDYRLEWQPAALVFGSQQSALLTMLPYVTVGDVPVDWAGAIPAGPSPQYRLAFLLYADTGMSSQAKTVHATALRSAALSGAEVPAADLLVQGLLRYALYAIPHGPRAPADPVNVAQLTLLAEQLSLPATATAGFSMAQLDIFFGANLHFVVSGVPAGPLPPEKSAMLFALPPGLAWTSTQAGDLDFSIYNKVGTGYEGKVASILGAYFPVGADATPTTPDDPNAYESFATYLFRDFCQMLVKAAVNEAQKQLVNVSVSVTAGMNLFDAAKTFATQALPCVKELGDTVQSVAARLGATVSELLFLNPSIEQTIGRADVGSPLAPDPVIGVSPDVLVQDNPGTTLKQSAWTLGDVSRAVGSPNATLSSLATLFNVTSVASLFAYVPPLASGQYTLGRNPNLLVPGRTFALSAQSWTPPANGGFDLAETAALFFVRYTNPDLSASAPAGSPDMPAWYAQAIAILNPSLLSSAMSDAGESVEIEPGLPLSVPLNYGDRSVTRPYPYVTVAGDTLHLIGCTLVLTQDADLLAVPPPQWAAFKAAVTQNGEAFALPAWPLAGQQGGIAILPGQTVESLARRLVVNASFAGGIGWSYAWSAITAWLGPAAVLSPTAVIVLPGASVSATQAFTFQTLADTYGLALADVAARLQGQVGLLPDPTTLVVKQAPTMTVSQIETRLLASTSFAGVVNQASQMMMSGLRLPGLKTVVIDGVSHVVADAANPQPLYDLSGQQFTLPVDSTPAHANDVALALTVTSSAAWVSFGQSFTVEPQHDMAMLNARHPELLLHNPGLAAANGLQPGMVLLSSSDDSDLQFSFTKQQILDDAPATGLKITTEPASAKAPSAMVLKGTSPNTYGFEHPVTLQMAQTLPIPSTGGTPLAGYASLWPFPQGLLERAVAQVATPYAIYAGSQPGPTIDNTRALASTYGCQLSFRMRRMDDGSHRFHLLGVDTDQRALLLALRDEILHGTLGPSTQAWIGFNPAPNSANAQGLTLLDSTIPAYIIKTNLSTDSQPQPALRALADLAPQDAPVYYADFTTQLANYLLLLWEGSVVGGAGFYVGFGQELPGSAFDSQGTATLSLLAIAGKQQAAVPVSQGRALEVFNNCLLLGQGLDASVHSLYAEGTDSSDLTEVALTPPGNAGFTLTIQTPPGGDTESDLQDRYNRLVFWCADTSSPYSIAPAWTPSLPKPSTGEQMQPWERQRQARQARLAGTVAATDDDTPSPYWLYQQVIPFYRFTTAPLPAAIWGLPDPAADPYCGFGKAQSRPNPLLTFCMCDLLGNHGQAAVQGQGAVNLQVGYTDLLIGLSQWPDLTAFFEVLGAPGSAQLWLQLGLKAASSVPTASQRGDAAVNAALHQGDKYAQIYYQLIQGGVQALLFSSLHFVAGNGQAIGLGPLWRYAGGAYAYARTAQQLGALTLPGTVLDTLHATYPVRYAEMAAANQDVALSDLFAAGSQVVVPAFLPFIAQRSLADLYAQRPKGWPDPGSAAALFSLSQNASLPLVVGVAMKRPAASSSSVSTGAAAATPSLAQLATIGHTSAGLLGQDNPDAAVLAADNGAKPGTPNVLTAAFTQADGSTLTVQVPVIAGDTDSFSGAQTAFAKQGVNLTVEQIADENAGIAGLLKANQTFASTWYVTKMGDTLASNASGVTTQALGQANATTQGVFDDGALVRFGIFTIALPATAHVADTLNMVSQRYACPADRLLSTNASLSCGNLLAVPGVFTWPQEAATLGAMRVPYTVQRHDLLSTLCTRFSPYVASAGGASQTTSVNDCVVANLDMPGTVAGNVPLQITVPGGNVNVTTVAGASFAATLQQAQAVNPQTTLDDLAAALGSTADVLEQGSLLLFPPARLPSTMAPQDIQGLYGVRADSFALANTATPGLLAPGQDLKLPDPNDPNDPKATVTVTTQANDTFNTVLVRFSLLGVASDAGAISLGNPDVPIFLAQALALVPPAQVRESVPLGAGGPYPQTVFALKASLTFTRPGALIHTDFDIDGPVARVSSPLAAHAQGDASTAGSLNFGPFIRALVDAIPTLRVGTAKVAGETSDLWCVDFSSTGISSVSLVPGVTFPKKLSMPRFLALPPLYDHLVTRSQDQLSIQPLNDDGTLSGTGVPTSFQAIDTEPWAQRFLADLDRFLGGDMATTLYGQSTLQATLTSAIDSKQTIAGSIANDLMGVFDYGTNPTVNPDPHYESGLAAARESLRQQIYVSLVKAYDTSVVVQYDVQSTTPWSGQSGVPPVSLYGQARLADTGIAVTFASAKTGFDATKPFVSFFATVADPARHSNVRGTLQYAYSQTEFNISEGGVPAGYMASNWLSFMPLQDKTAKPTALKGTDPGTLLAPVPLRTFPALPTVREQSASPTDTVPKSLERMPLWTYALTCSHEFAAQDGVTVTADFNLSTPPMMLLAVPTADLFSSLAQYMAVADKLWTLLAPLLNPTGTLPPASLNAAQTFAQLAATLAQNWHVRLPQNAGNVAPQDNYVVGESFVFDARVTYSEDGQAIQSFSLKREQAQPGPGNIWPGVAVLLPGDSMVTLQPENPASTGDTMVYAPPPDTTVSAQAQQTFRLSWADINVSAYQNARARMHALRNQNLLYDPQHLENPELPTAQAFLLKTAEVTATSIVTPLIDRSVPQLITGTTVSQALTDAIITLFPEATRVAGTTASWGVSYAYELARDGASASNSLISRLPVALYPNQPLDGAAQSLAAAVKSWRDANHPESSGGGWLFEVILYSGLESSLRPLFVGELHYLLS